MSDPVAIEVQQLAKSFQSQVVLNDVDLSVSAGQFICLLGASGCGKSTLLRIMAGLESADRGIFLREAQQNEIGFVFQQPNLLPWRRVLSNIELPLQLRGMDRKQRRKLGLEKMTEVGLSEADAKKWPAMLSGGMKMRASLARTLVTSPKLLLLDEPFAALDEVLRQRLNEDLRVWHRQNGWTTVFVTHHVSEAVFLADRIVIMQNANDGRPSIAAVIENDLRSKTGDESDGEAAGHSLRDSDSYLRQISLVSRQLREVNQ